MKKLLRFLRPYSLWIFLSTIFSTVLVWFSAQIPVIMVNIINNGAIKGDNDLIASESLRMLIYVMIDFSSMTGLRLTSSYIGRSTYYDLKEAIAAKVLSLGAAEVKTFSISSLINRTEKDASTVASFIRDLIAWVQWAIISIIVIIWQAYLIAPRLMWTILLSASIISLAVFIITKVAIPKIKTWRKLSDKITAITREGITGARVIRAFSRESHSESRFDSLNRDVLRVSFFIDRVYTLEGPVINFIFLCSTGLIMWLGSNYAMGNIAYVGILMAFMSYAEKITHAFLTLLFVFSELPRAIVSAKRVNEVLETENTVTWKEQTVGMLASVSGIEFKDVRFRFSDAKQDLLKGISFTASRGEVTAIVGSTGSGKTTIANLILRTHDVTGGEIIVDGIDLRNYSKPDLMAKIGYVPQKGILFSGTITDNIKFGNPSAKKADVVMAAKLAMADEFISALPKQYQSPVSGGGKNFSGGQKQRLSIARALVKKPSILIFDDAFSALDMKTDAKLRRAILPELKKSVTIIVAQRLSTIKNADKIIVLDRGKIVGSGKHNDLIKTCETYKDIARSQNLLREAKHA